MAIENEPPEPDLSNIRKHLRAARPLWRLFGWGGAAALALIALAVTSLTDTGSQQLQSILAGNSAGAAAQAPQRRVEKDPDTLRLEAQVRNLTVDRDQLIRRLAMLERTLDDMTGSIKQLATVTATPTPPPQPSAPATVVSTPPAAVAPAAKPAAAPAPLTLTPLAMPAKEASGTWPNPPQAQSAQAEPVPLPPTRMAAAPPPEAAIEPPAQPPKPAKPELGIDLGSARNIETLRLRWAAVKANYGPLLAGLAPVATTVHRANGTEIRLVVGPVADLTSARALCSRFAAVRMACHPARFDGQLLTLQ